MKRENFNSCLLAWIYKSQLIVLIVRSCCGIMKANVRGTFLFMKWKSIHWHPLLIVLLGNEWQMKILMVISWKEITKENFSKKSYFVVILMLDLKVRESSDTLTIWQVNTDTWQAVMTGLVTLHVRQGRVTHLGG